jgi:hypothetical protein
MKPTVQVLYSCKGCKLVDAVVTVVARGDEDVIAWLEGVKPKIAADHVRRSPHCRAGACDLKIPMGDDGSRVGDPVKRK